MITHLATALGFAASARNGFAQQLQRIAAGPAPAPARNGGRDRTVAQDQRRAARCRATHRAKRLGHR